MAASIRRLVAFLSISLCAMGPSAAATFVDTTITDNGDGFADTNETIEIGITVAGRFPWEAEQHDCVARLSTASTAVDCVPRAEIFIGDLPASGQPVTPAGKFAVKIGDVDRQRLGLGPHDPLQAKLRVEISCSSGDGLPRELSLPLDLNLSDLEQTPMAWHEGFESGTLGSFAPQNNDAGIPGGSNAEGRGSPTLTAGAASTPIPTGSTPRPTETMPPSIAIRA